jgi:hypothetical protein
MAICYNLLTHETSFLQYTLKYAQRRTIPELSVKWQVPVGGINET